MTPTARAVRSSVALIGVALVAAVSSCAVAPAPVAAPAPQFLTVTYDGAGPGAARLGLIGDSTMASIRWAGAYEPLRRWNHTFDAESCRRTATLSCHGADGYAPANGLEVMHRLRGRLGSVLVMMLGANDPVGRFGEGIDAVVAEARAQGIGTVVWLTIAAAPDKNAVLAERAEQHGGYLVVADWAAYSAPHPEWVNPDGLHISTAGAGVLAQFIADHAAPLL